jgi:hypothetical protein
VFDAAALRCACDVDGRFEIEREWFLAVHVFSRLDRPFQTGGSSGGDLRVEVDLVFAIQTRLKFGVRAPAFDAVLFAQLTELSLVPSDEHRFRHYSLSAREFDPAFLPNRED